jgi:MoaA/NifB/PqqE/SkfB family radical SAM enzyme
MKAPVAAAPSPYLHRDADGFYNPVTGVRIGRLDPAFGRVERFLSAGASLDEETHERLSAARFLIDDVLSESRRFALLCVSLETCSVCNHRCDFCPVSVDPREAEVMPQDLFERIVGEIADVATPRTMVFLSNYNEPTVDPLFEERCRCLFDRGLAVSLLTNATGLKPALAARLAGRGRFRYLGVNLPTLDPERYRALHGTRDLARVIANVEAVSSMAIAEERAIVALGEEDDRHRRDVETLRDRFGPLGWDVRPFKIRSRAGQIGSVLPPPKRRLAGCDLMGSRPFEHLHVTAGARAVLCCQDYYEKWVVGDLRTESVAQVLGGETIARLRRWAYGVEDAPDDFLCRRCEFALGQ